ncbi:unnamed protein product [Protopolystoma xenopodis]|uniref:Uncharacterized protein n=1 Tax=Protopolystoma xenopodis TaxID=117903 RepID=A0A3S5BLU6_9PLAT|nr:unnamed protein product [Protopolystoma xenopodis]
MRFEQCLTVAGASDVVVDVGDAVCAFTCDGVVGSADMDDDNGGDNGDDTFAGVCADSGVGVCVGLCDDCRVGGGCGGVSVAFGFACYPKKIALPTTILSCSKNCEKGGLAEQLSGVTRCLKDHGVEKQEMERELSRVQKEHSLCKKNFEKAERERSRLNDNLARLQKERIDLEQTSRRLEEENMDLRRSIQKLESMQQEGPSHTALLLETSGRHRFDAEAELERQRISASQTEKTVQLRERAHRQRVKGLEEQVRINED